MVRHTIINPTSLAPPQGYNHGLLTAPGGRWLFVAGQVGWDEHGKMVGPNFLSQFRQALQNVLVVVSEAGGAPSDIVRLTYYIIDTRDYHENLAHIGVIYRELMGSHYVPSTMVQVAGLVEAGGRVEIEATAVIPQ